MKIAVLAVQGAFAEHRKKIEDLGIECMELRKKEDLMKPFDGLILPGGESTVQGKLLKELDIYQILKQKIEEGLPVLATCAGLILLAENLTNDRIGKIPMTFIRAPYIEKVGKGVEVLAAVDDRIVAVKYGTQFGLAFHPELDQDNRIHEMFLDTVKAAIQNNESAIK